MTTKLDDPKFDGGKNRLDLIDPEFIVGTGLALTYGVGKYEEYSWQRVEGGTNRYYGAFMRHIIAWRGGESHDEESGLHHLQLAAANLMFVSWFDRKGGEIYDKEKLKREWLKDLPRCSSESREPNRKSGHDHQDRLRLNSEERRAGYRRRLARVITVPDKG